MTWQLWLFFIGFGVVGAGIGIVLTAASRSDDGECQ